MKEDIRERMVRLPASGITTRLLEAGAGPPLLLLHGNPDNADEWQRLIGLLAGEFRCLAPDVPGYGRSPEPPASFGYTVDDQVAFVDALLAEAGVTEPVTVVVHDIGGMMGVPWVARNLARVRGLMITNTVAFEGFKWFGIARRWGDASFTGRLRSALMMWAIGLRGGAPFKRAFGQQNPQLDPAELDRITRTFALNTAAKNASLRQFRELLRGDFFSGFDAMNEAITAAVPTRVLWGDGDPYVATQYAQRFARAKATVLPGVGHWVPMVAADRLADEIRALVGVPG